MTLLLPTFAAYLVAGLVLGALVVAIAVGRRLAASVDALARLGR